MDYQEVDKEYTNYYRKERPSFEEQTIRCRSCEKSLFSVLVLETAIQPYIIGRKAVDILHQTIQSNCPFCKDKSWLFHTTTKTMIKAVDGLYLSSIDQSVENHDMTMEIILKEKL